MRRVLFLGLLLVLVVAGFYLAWPAWTGRQIRNAIEANDPAALAQKIDFEQVRARARPLIATQMQRSLDQLQKQGGPFGAAIAGQLKASLGEKLANAAIDAALTPENVIRLARQGKDISRILKDIARDAPEKRAGTEGAPAPAPAPSGAAQPPEQPQPHRRLTRENVKSYRITGPLSIEVGVAHDAQAATHDVLVELAFTGADWKVVGILPQF